MTTQSKLHQLDDVLLDGPTLLGSELSVMMPNEWKAPRLSRLGDVRELTLGGSPGAGDSGNPSTFMPPV